jgi:hypothetical protein
MILMGVARQAHEKAAAGACDTHDGPSPTGTLAMLTLLDPPDLVQCDPDELPGPTDADLAWYRARLTGGHDGPPPAHLTMLDWVQTRRDYYGYLCDEGDAEMALAMDAMTAVWCAIEMHRPATVAALIRNRNALCHRADLSAVRVPERRKSVLAGILDEEAREFLRLGTDLGDLCAWYLLRQADDCERFGSSTVEDYLADEAAHRAAWEDAAAEGY